MSRHLLTLYSAADRDRATAYIRKAPPGTRVELKAAKRSLDQNSKMWACLTDIAQQIVWHGQKLTPEQLRQGACQCA